MEATGALTAPLLMMDRWMGGWRNTTNLKPRFRGKLVTDQQWRCLQTGEYTQGEQRPNSGVKT